MTIKHIVLAISYVVVLSSSGCSNQDAEPSAFVERAAAPAPVLTSTVSVSEVEPQALQHEPGSQETEVSAVQPESNPAQDDAPTFEPTIESIDGLTIRRLATSSEISGREPIGATSTFGPDHDRVHAFLEVSNESTFPRKLVVHFIGPKAKVTGGVELEIPASAPRWRTWAYTKHFDEPGLWRVEVRDEAGQLLGALPFEVEPRL